MYGIGKGVEIVRKKRNHTQESLAELINSTQARISLIENGISMPTSSTLQKIADALEVNPAIIIWFSITRDDAPKEKMEMFDILKPSIDEMVLKIFDPKSKLNH